MGRPGGETYGARISGAFLFPITDHELLQHPVLAADGYIYIAVLAVVNIRQAVLRNSY
jgi:hypothetical protein